MASVVPAPLSSRSAPSTVAYPAATAGLSFEANPSSCVDAEAPVTARKAFLQALELAQPGEYRPRWLQQLHDKADFVIGQDKPNIEAMRNCAEVIPRIAALYG